MIHKLLLLRSSVMSVSSASSFGALFCIFLIYQLFQIKIYTGIRNLLKSTCIYKQIYHLNLLKVISFFIIIVLIRRLNSHDTDTVNDRRRSPLNIWRLCHRTLSLQGVQILHCSHIEKQAHWVFQLLPHYKLPLSRLLSKVSRATFCKCRVEIPIISHKWFIN